MQIKNNNNVKLNLNYHEKVFTSPTYGKVWVEAGEIKSISIFNILGEKVFGSDADGDVFEYDFSQQKAGTYFIKVVTAKGVETKQVTVL